MEVKVNLEDYLSEEEIREECKYAIRKIIYETYSKESSQNRLISNLSYEILFKEISKCINEDAKTLITKQVIELIKQPDNIRYLLFRKKDAWDKEESIGYTILKQAIKDSENLIKEKVEEAIKNYNLGGADEIRDAIMDCFADKIDEKLFTINK